LRASILTSEQRTAQAKTVFAQAEQEEKALGYREPPAYIRPVGETEAAALMSIGDWEGAKRAFEKALVERPTSGFSLYGIALSSEQSGEATRATAEYADFLAAWKDADRELPQIAHARTYLADHAHGSQKVGE
jgi:hypothetical protein